MPNPVTASISTVRWRWRDRMERSYRACTVDIPESVLSEAIRHAQVRTKREVINAEHIGLPHRLAPKANLHKPAKSLG